jgi:hypothetical protein
VIDAKLLLDTLDERGCHLNLDKHVLRYVRGTVNLGLHLRASSTLDLRTFTDKY